MIAISVISVPVSESIETTSEDTRELLLLLVV